MRSLIIDDLGSHNSIHVFCDYLKIQYSVCSFVLRLALPPTQFPCFLSICLFFEVFINLKSLRMPLSETEGELPNPLRGFRTSYPYGSYSLSPLREALECNF
jgi:hypothetical protein